MATGTVAKTATPTIDTLKEMVVRPIAEGPQPIAPEVIGKVADLLRDAPMLQGDRSSLLNRIMECQTLDDAATLFSGLDSTKDVVGLPLMIHSFALSPSDYDAVGSLPFYATVFAEDRTRTVDVTFNTGSTSIVVTLLTGWRREWFPFTAHIEAKSLANGYTAYNLRFDA